MSLIMKQLLKYGISVLDKENVTEDQIEYVYKKWGRWPEFYFTVGLSLK